MCVEYAVTETVLALALDNENRDLVNYSKFVIKFDFLVTHDFYFKLS